MKDFIPCKEALALKELDFDELFMIRWDSAEMGTYYCLGRFNDVRFEYQIKIPYSQAFRWFREEFKIFGRIQEKKTIANLEFIYIITGFNGFEQSSNYKTYEEAELACLRKLIEIVKTK